MRWSGDDGWWWSLVKVWFDCERSLFKSPMFEIMLTRRWGVGGVGDTCLKAVVVLNVGRFLGNVSERWTSQVFVHLVVGS